MKRIFLLSLLLLTLCGCSAGGSGTDEFDVPDETAADEPTGFYAPDSELESATGGAVQVYPLNRNDCYGMLPMGEDILLFAGTENTTLIKVSGSNLYITAETALDFTIAPEDPGVQVSEKGVTFYDEPTHELVFLDTGLNEVSRFSLPEDIQGSPSLSADRKSLYYCTADSLRVLDLETGFQKLLKEMYFPEQTIGGLHCGDTVVECSILRSDGDEISLFISADTGETLWEELDDLTLTTCGEVYFAVHADGSYQEMLVGTTDIGPYALYFDEVQTTAMPLLANNRVVLAAPEQDQSAVTLHYFDLESGRRTAQLTLSGPGIPWSIHADSAENCVWLLRYDESYQCDTVYRWHPEQSPTADGSVYVSSRFTYEEPDTEGLVRCRQMAAEVSEKYGVDIHIWTDAVSLCPPDYTLTAEYQVPAILASLEVLDQALANYPADFLKTAAKRSTSGAIQLCLVRHVDSTTDSIPGDISGTQFWSDDEDVYICLEAGSTLEQSLYHELFHVIDSRVLSTCSAYDDWSDLNPEGFEYDFNYLTNQYREDSGLTEGDSRAFIDTYSMSFPKEDRARIMEYAMMADNESCFTSPIMQAKLKQLCLGIRQSFKLEDAEESFLWEQYLAEPLS